LNKAPHFIREQLTFPYLSGSNFLLKVSYSDPENRNQAFTRFPHSTEQILHPEKYLAADLDEPTTIVTTDSSSKLGAGWNRTISNVFGEIQVKLLFENWREWDQAKTASEGWDGDRYDLYRNGQQYAFVWFSRWDSAEDATEFFEGISSLLREKRYKSHFAHKQFTGTGNTRELSDEGTSYPLLLRFTHEGANASVVISNSAEAAETLAPSHFRFEDTSINVVNVNYIAPGKSKSPADADSDTSVPR
jgi:hypothetical protein